MITALLNANHKPYFMEPFMLTEKKISERKYRHFTYIPKPETQPRTKIDFFYIGKKISNIDILIKVFESGYAAENADKANAMLLKLMRSNTLPDCIIAEDNLSESSIQNLTALFSSYKELASIPFFVELSDMSNIEKFHGVKFVDDLVTVDQLPAAQLNRKVHFWKKVKQRSREIGQVKENFEFRNRITSVIKRTIDIFLSLSLLITLSPLFLLIMIALRLESKGPGIYVSKRAGRGYRIFTFYKFRTMVSDADKKMDHLSHLNQYDLGKKPNPMFIKINNDPRVTRVGMFLRKTSMDELPQLWNVLKGDMSLVGNRPLPLYEAETLTTDEWSKRFLAPAGITGLWQIKKRGKESMSAEERVSLDIDYAEKATILRDLYIMAITPTALIQKTNV